MRSISVRHCVYCTLAEDQACCFDERTQSVEKLLLFFFLFVLHPLDASHGILATSQDLLLNARSIIRLVVTTVGIANLSAAASYLTVWLVHWALQMMMSSSILLYSVMLLSMGWFSHGSNEISIHVCFLDARHACVFHRSIIHYEHSPFLWVCSRAATEPCPHEKVLNSVTFFLPDIWVESQTSPCNSRINDWRVFACWTSS